MLLVALLIGLVLGAAAGAAVAWTTARERAVRTLSAMRDRAADAEISAQDAIAQARREQAIAETQREEREARVAALEHEVEDARAATAAAIAEAAAHREALARAETLLEDERRAAGEKLAVVREAETQFREAFAALSSDALSRNNRAFLDLAQEALAAHQQRASGQLELREQAIGELVAPIREALASVDAQVRAIETAREGAYAALREQVRALHEGQAALSSETANLVRALRSPTTRGRWGEIQLRRVLEMAGMLRHCDFLEQRTLEGEDGRLRPDVVVRLAGGRCIVVDAKTPLDAYLSAVEAADDAERARHTKQHVRQVRDHIAKLGAKQYWGQVQPAPDLVVMFVPAQTFLDAALQEDPALFEHALEQRVMLASPANLIALLHTVAYGWRQEQIAEHAAQMGELGRQLFDRLCKMSEHVDRLRRSIDATVEAYNGMVGSYESRVLVSARRFGELGVTVTQELPEASEVTKTTRALHGLPLLEAGPSDDDGEADADDVPLSPDTPPRYLVR